MSESQNPRAPHMKASEKVTIRSSGASHWMCGVANGRRRCEARVTLKALRTTAAFLGNGITVVVFHNFCSTPSRRELLNIDVTGPACCCAKSPRANFIPPSGFVYFNVRKWPFSNFHTDGVLGWQWITDVKYRM